MKFTDYTQLNDGKQREDILKKYNPSIFELDNEGRKPIGFEKLYHVTPSDAKLLMTGLPNVDPQATQNCSPTMQQLIEYAEKYNGELSGYAHKNSEIMFDTLILNCTELEALRVFKDTLPDEFHQQTGEVYILQTDYGHMLCDNSPSGAGRLWWDYWRIE